MALAAAGVPKFGSLENLLDADGTIHGFLEANYKDIDALREYWESPATTPQAPATSTTRSVAPTEAAE